MSAKLDTIHQSLCNGKIDQRAALEAARDLGREEAAAAVCAHCQRDIPIHGLGCDWWHIIGAESLACDAAAIRSLADGGQK